MQNEETRDRVAKALREYQMSGRILIEWARVTKSAKKKWLDLADVALNAANRGQDNDH
jgi:hypothetical protein